MKRAKFITALAIALASAASSWAAGWNDLRAGLDEKSTLAAVGTPIIASRSKSRVHSTWTYDKGGYIQFERGKVAYWQMPQGGRDQAASNQPALSAAPVAQSAPVQSVAKPTLSHRLVIVR